MTFEQHANGRSSDKDPNHLANMPDTPQPQKGLTSKDDASDADIKTDAPDSKKVNKTIFAIGGCKGGVGKSALAVNLAVGLSLLSQKVDAAGVERKMLSECRCIGNDSL
jgi:Mrp family chromosome partitioning ATPase